MPVLHFSLGSNWSKQNEALFFVWSLIALGVNGLFSVMLWVSELRRIRSERHVSGADQSGFDPSEPDDARGHVL